MKLFLPGRTQNENLELLQFHIKPLAANNSASQTSHHMNQDFLCPQILNQWKVTHLQIQQSQSSHIPFARNPLKTSYTIYHTGCNQISQVWSHLTHWAWFYLYHLPFCQVSSTQWHFHKTGGKQWKKKITCIYVDTAHWQL